MFSHTKKSISTCDGFLEGALGREQGILWLKRDHLGQELFRSLASMKLPLVLLSFKFWYYASFCLVLNQSCICQVL